MLQMKRNGTRVRLGLVSALAAAALGMVNSAPAQAADSITAFTVAGYNVQAGASVVCNNAQRTMTVSARASTMQATGPFGPMPGPYDNGQYFTYRVLVRDMTSTTWGVTYSWGQWSWIKGKYASGDFLFPTMNAFPDLGISTRAGHNYQVIFQFDWWTGKETS